MQMIPFFNWMKQQSRQENIIYLVMWGMLFAAPILSLYVRSLDSHGHQFLWSDVFMVWQQFTVYLVLFLVHNFLLAPLLVYHRKKVLYGSIVTIILAAFIIYQCSSRPGMPHHKDPHGKEFFEEARKTPPPMHQPAEFHKPPHRMPPAIIGEHDVVSVVILILMLGMNLGIKLYFKNIQDQRKLIELQKESLVQQLEYLKYQLNPHFLMNTLNNIHALIEIEPPKAQEAVIQLSKILRYVLYESNKPFVPISQEAAFMDHYVQLMRMRYSDRLQFTLQIPDKEMEATIPPLLFISFVENAFKHGVSYQQPSFIEVSCKCYLDNNHHERLLWTCRNSKHNRPDSTSVPQQGGVGMTNVRQRLNLIYGNDYRLDIHETDSAYEVVLDIPLNKK